MKRVLLLDIERCFACKDMSCLCSYPHQPYANGINGLLEVVAFNCVCKQCSQAPCVKSCPTQSLEKLPDANLKRYNTRCISCKSCVLACPFGVILPQAVAYLASGCDLCSGRLTAHEKPSCVISCPHAALEYADIDEEKEKNIKFLNDSLAVRCINWHR